jgi:hypothetical protein
LSADGVLNIKRADRCLLTIILCCGLTNVYNEQALLIVKERRCDSGRVEVDG